MGPILEGVILTAFFQASDSMASWVRDHLGPGPDIDVEEEVARMKEETHKLFDNEIKRFKTERQKEAYRKIEAEVIKKLDEFRKEPYNINKFSKHLSKMIREMEEEFDADTIFIVGQVGLRDNLPGWWQHPNARTVLTHLDDKEGREYIYKWHKYFDETWEKKLKEEKRYLEKQQRKKQKR